VADFSVVLVQTIDPPRLTYAAWIDPPQGEDPTRLNPRAHVAHRYARLQVEAMTTGTLELNAIVNGVQAPADAALGGRLFDWSIGEGPVGAPWPVITSPIAGKTSRAQIDLAAIRAYPGHWLVAIARPGSGGVVVAFDVELDS
jgi:hypothetical protein